MINITGQILDSSGYAIHTRELAKALSKITDVRLSSKVPDNATTLLSDKEVQLLKKGGEKNDINLIITNPLYWRTYADQNRNWVYLVWEGDKLPLSYFNECLNPAIEYIIVPSEHTKKALEETCQMHLFHSADEVLDKVRVIPHGVDLDKFYPKDKKEDVFTFIANKGLRNLEDRGGIQYLLQAFNEEFTKDDKVRLLIKINPVYGIPNMDDIMKQLEIDPKNCPDIKVTADNIPHEKLIDLYSEGDVFVSPTRAEAFNLPCLEAMACGLPVITTNFGGQTDYVTQENGWLVGGDLTEIKHELQYEGIAWITPDIKGLQEALRYVFKNKDLVKEKGCKALETAKNLTWDNTSKLIKELI